VKAPGAVLFCKILSENVEAVPLPAVTPVPLKDMVVPDTRRMPWLTTALFPAERPVPLPLTLQSTTWIIEVGPGVRTSARMPVNEFPAKRLLLTPMRALFLPIRPKLLFSDVVF
jgi:hypothetical protein